MDVQGLALLLELFDFNGDLVRQLGAHLAHDFLAHKLRGEETAAAVGDLVFREEVIVFRQVLGNHAFQCIEVMPVLCGNRDDLRVRQLFLQPGQVRHQLGLVFDAVGLVQRHDQRAGHVLDALENHLVFFGPLGAVDHEDHHVDVFQRRRSGLVHVAVQGLFAALVHTRGVDVDRLHIALGLDTEHVVTGGLRFARGDRQLLTQDVVQQRGLAHVRTADDGNIATASCVCISHCHSPHPGQSVLRRPLPVRQYDDSHPDLGFFHSVR
ncbi:hypothetical protein D3C73_754260 [compost metagenome]